MPFIEHFSIIEDPRKDINIKIWLHWYLIS